MAQYYEKRLSEMGIKYITISPNTKSSRHLFVIMVEDRDEIIAKLQAEGIGCAVNYRAIHTLKFYKDFWI